MKNFRHLLALAAGVALLSFSLYAQPSPNPPDPKNREQLESAKIAFFTSQMSLTPEEATKFWPVYNEYHEALCEARKQAREGFKAIRDLLEKGGYSDVEMKKCMLEYITLCTKDDEIEKLYMDEFLKVLPVEKVARMYVAEEDFRAKMIRMWKKPDQKDPKEKK